MQPIIEIEHLCKRFGSIQAVQDLSFQVLPGQLFAFLGENGAGKSTTISILCGQLAADSGAVYICGQDCRQAVAQLGVVFQNSVLDQPLTLLDNLRSRAALYGIRGDAFRVRLAELDDLLDIQPLLRRPVAKLSGGQRRRADIARALIHRPGILVLDEPTTGLDPQTRKLVWDAIGRLRREQQLTVLLTTHYMEEAAGADEIVILDRGCIVAQGTPLELKNRYTGDFIHLYGVPEDQVSSLGLPMAPIPGGWRVQVSNTAQAAALIAQRPELFPDFEVVKGTMDDVFLAVTGRKLKGGEEK